MIVELKKTAISVIAVLVLVFPVSAAADCKNQIPSSRQVGDPQWVGVNERPLSAYGVGDTFKKYGVKKTGPEKWGEDRKDFLIHGERVTISKIVEYDKSIPDMPWIVQIKREGGQKFLVNTSGLFAYDFTTCEIDDLLRERTNFHGGKYKLFDYLPVLAKSTLKPVDGAGNWIKDPTFTSPKFLTCSKLQEAGSLVSRERRSLECQPYPVREYSVGYYFEIDSLKIMAFEDSKRYYQD